MKLSIIILGTLCAICLFINYSCNSTQSKKELVTQENTIFIGNSIIEYWNMTHPEFFTQNNYIPKSIVGQTTMQILDRFEEDVIANKPCAVFIEGGINDIAENTDTFDPAKTFNNIKSMAEMADQEGIKVILASLTPTDSIHWKKDLTDISNKVINLNNQIKEYAKNKNFEYVDFYTAMVDKNGKTMIKEYTTDGVHITELGYQVMEPIVKQAINKTLAKK